MTHSIKDEIGAHMLIPIVTAKNNGKNYSMFGHSQDVNIVEQKIRYLESNNSSLS